MNSRMTFKTSSRDTAPLLVDFLLEIGEELRLQERRAAQDIVDLLFDRGGVVVGEAEGRIVALMGFQQGTAEKNFTDQHLGFVLVAAIAKAYRHTGTFRNLMVVMAQEFVERQMTEFRCHAEASNAYTNMLYSKIAEPIRTEKNRRGLDCVLYGNTVANVLAYLQKGPSRRRNCLPVQSPAS